MLAIIFLLNNCVHRPIPPQEFRSNERLSLDQAVSILGKNLKMQLDQSVQNKANQILPIVIDPILSIQSGQQAKANKKVETILTRELGSGFTVNEINTENLPKARYILTGALSQTADVNITTQSSCDLVVAIISYPDGEIVAKGQIKISDFPFQPLVFYEDSPIFLQDKSVRLAKSFFDSSISTLANPEYMQFLPEKASIQQGITSYEKGQYTEAADSFTQATAQPNGKTLTSYAGLYLASQKLNREDDAGHAFADLLSLAIEENHRLDIRLLFDVNSATFISNPELVKHYAWWLKHIAVHVDKSNLCLKIIGHCSKSGNEKYNEHLSLSRAKTVQKILAVTYPGIIKKSYVEGKGYRENIVGTGADDASDVIDRRVELSIIECSELPQKSRK
jgi:outer membrane protein OmpA-like peptidoglycan-associated protein